MKKGINNVNFTEKEIREIVDKEIKKAPWHMDWDLVKEGLECLYPTTEEDILEVQRLLKEFYESYVPMREAQCRHKRKRRVTIAMVCLLTMIFATGICYALGIDLWSIAVQWTKEHLNMTIITTGVEDESVENQKFIYSNQVRETWGDELCDILEQERLEVNLPEWIPSGYEFQGYEVPITNLRAFCMVIIKKKLDRR